MQQVCNLSARIIKYQNQIKETVNRVIDSGYFILGPEVDKFEKAFACFHRSQYCISLANGTESIELALKAMHVGPKDLVATVANAGMYVTTSILAAGAEPYFMDVSLETKNVTFNEVRSAIEAGVKAVVVTHLYGLAIAEIEQIAQYCAQKKIFLLEDCAQAHGAQVNGRRVGTFGDASSFSFYPTKNLGALGDGGAVVTNNREIAEEVKLLRQYGWTSKYKVNIARARNSRLDEIQAAILSLFLPELNMMNDRRREIANYYTTMISHPDILVPSVQSLDYVAHLYVIRSSRRDELRNYLLARNIASDVHYPIPDYKQPFFCDRYKNIHLSNTERLAKEILTLPCYPEMENNEVDQVISAINGWGK